MRSRVLRRRSATVLGVYVATALGFLTTVVATRELGTGDYARFAAIVAVTAFLQLLLDLSVEEVLVKYGFRYAEAQRWGRLRRIFEIAFAYKLIGGLVAGIALAALAPVIGSIWNVDDVLVPMLVAAAIPVLQAPEGVAGGAVILRGRYDVRGALLAISMGLRLTGVGIGAMYGLTEAVLGMVIGQAIATLVISIVGFAAFRRFPQARSEPLGDDRAAVRRFVLSSTVASSLVSARGTLGTALMPVVAPIDQTGYFRNAQAPATGFAALSSPARLVLLTEQTRDFEAGRYDQMYGMLRRYIVGTTSLMVVAVPLLWVLMPFLMGLLYGPAFREHATTAARLVLIAAAMQLIWGWSKSFPVSIGRPGLRIVVQSVEIAVFVPLLLWFGSEWGATGRRGGDGRLDRRVLSALGRAARPATARTCGAGGPGELRILLVSGIWPPDVGGPASHAPEVAAFMRGRGHDVEAVITADGRAGATPAIPSAGCRARCRSACGTCRASGSSRARARDADVVYTTGMFGRSSLGAGLARTPFVIKLTADRGVRALAAPRPLAAARSEEFQRQRSLRTAPLRLARNADVRRAAHVVTPSGYLRELALGWGVPPDRVTVLPNPAPPVPELRPRDELRRELGFDGPTLVFAGRLAAQKSLDVGIEAARRAGVALAIAGDGPDREALQRLGHARFLGPLPRQRVLELFRAGDASLLSSSWENFPHTVVEALAVGTPVIATRTGGVAEVVRDGENGLLVEPGDVAALAVAIDRFFGDAELAERLRANAAPSVADYSAERVYGRLEEILLRAAGA